MSPTDTILSNVKELREQRDWSQSQLAQESGLSRSEVSAIETGRLVPSTTAALRLARAFACRVEDLFRLRSEDDSSAVSWAWQPSLPAAPRYWQARVGDASWRFPVEALPTGELASDGPATRPELARDTLVLAVCDPAVGLLARRLEQAGIRCIALVRSSRAALQLLAEGKVHAAGIHLGANSDENRHIAAELLPPGFSIARLAVWEEGLAHAPGGSAFATTPGALRRLRWVGREPGSGARRCADSLLENPDTPPRGYERHARDHRGVAEAISTGWADVGVCVRLAAEEVGLEFHSVRREAYDLCFRDAAAADPRLQALLRILKTPDFRASIAALPGYEADGCGDVAPIAPPAP